MTKAQVKRSPFFFVGDKYKLIPQLSQFFPDDISTYIEPFVGGGSSLINVNAQSYIANDINEYVVGLHKALSEYIDDLQSLLDKLTFDSRAFVYLDPPYLISASEYNKLWNEAKEAEMYEVLMNLIREE